MFAWYHRRWIDLVTAIYIYNEHRGYTALDRVLAAVKARSPDEKTFIAEIELHRADERKHYVMFKRWFEKRGRMPIFVDRACGHIDRFVELLFGTRIDDLDNETFVQSDEDFAKLCRVIALTERRGYAQVEILLKHPAILADPQLTKIFKIIKQDEPRHWSPYEAWLKRNQCREPAWWERAVDGFIHSELLFLKLPVLFLSPGLKRRNFFADADEAADGCPLAAAA